MWSSFISFIPSSKWRRVKFPLNFCKQEKNRNKTLNLCFNKIKFTWIYLNQNYVLWMSLNQCSFSLLNYEKDENHKLNIWLQEHEGTLFICQKQLEWSRSILAFILFYSIWHTDSSLNQLALQLPSAQAEQGKIFINRN